MSMPLSETARLEARRGMHRPVDLCRGHLRNSPDAEAAIGREPAAEKVGAGVGVLWSAEAILVRPVLKVMEDLARCRRIDGCLVVFLIDHGGAELVQHRVRHEPEGGAIGPVEVEAAPSRHAVHVALGELLGNRRQRLPGFRKVLVGIETSLAPDRVVGEAGPVAHLGGNSVELALEADAVEAAGILRGQRRLVRQAHRRIVYGRKDVCVVVLRDQHGALIEYVRTRSRGEGGQQLGGIFRNRDDLMIHLDVGIGLLELGDDLLVDGDPRRMLVHPHLDRHLIGSGQRSAAQARADADHGDECGLNYVSSRHYSPLPAMRRRRRRSRGVC